MIRRLVVNADDFGLSPGVNRGIAHAHDRGIVTSTSLMVRPESAAEAAALARERPALAVGIHVDLGEWVFEEVEWRERRRVVELADPDAIAREVAEQLAIFADLMGRNPTHIDSHQHVHTRGPARGVVAAASRRLNVPLRQHSDEIAYCGGFYGQTGKGQPLSAAITIEALVDVIRSIPPGVTELACHPGYADDLNQVYNRERELELAALCDPAARQAIDDAGIELCSFRDLARTD